MSMKRGRGSMSSRAVRSNRLIERGGLRGCKVYYFTA